MKIIMSGNASILREELAKYENTATVEAEFGDILVSGTRFTMAHHGIHKHNPAPCLFMNIECELDAIGLSHVDLDSLGGVLALLNKKPENDSFWNLAAFIDVNGAHKIGISGASKMNKIRLNAFWAWSNKNKMFAPRDSFVDVSEWIESARIALVKILNDDEEMLDAGIEFMQQNKELNDNSIVSIVGNVLLRNSESFCNHLYEFGGQVYSGVVSYNPKFGTVTCSLESPNDHVSCKSIVQQLWGEKAGGHDGIAGSPREGGLTMDDAQMCAELLNNSLEFAKWIQTGSY